MTVAPANIGQFSLISNISTAVSLGELLTVDIVAFDRFGNKQTTGGQEPFMTIKVYKQNDELDVVPHEVVDNLDGTYQIDFSPEKSGTFVFDLTYLSDQNEVHPNLRRVFRLRASR